VHQTTASEHEFLQSLFGVGAGRRMVGQPRSAEEGLVKDALDKDLEGLSRPLKVRDRVRSAECGARSASESGVGFGAWSMWAGEGKGGRGEESGARGWTQVDVRGRSVKGRGVRTRKWEVKHGGRVACSGERKAESGEWRVK
jgi:hypothetical protein